jgi:hypothetical protein
MKAQKLMCQSFIKSTKSQKVSVLHYSIDYFFYHISATTHNFVTKKLLSAMTHNVVAVKLLSATTIVIANIK